MNKKAKDFYEKHLADFDDRITREVGKILQQHNGLRFAIKREALVRKIIAIFGPQREMDRKVRKAIEELRASGWLIGSSLRGEGYYMIQTKPEYDAFRDQYTKRAYQVMETAKAMDQAAGSLFDDKPEPKQMGWLD